jgi:Flp pilus assembly protein TadG
MRHFTYGNADRSANGGRGGLLDIERYGADAWVARWQRILRDDCGQTLVEVAVVLPAYFALLFGLFGFGVALFGMMNANYAVNTAVRYASLGSSSSTAPATTQAIQAIVITNLYLPAAVTPTVSVTYTHAGTVYYDFAGAAVGDLATVSVVWNNPPIWGIQNITIGAAGQRMVTR